MGESAGCFQFDLALVPFWMAGSQMVHQHLACTAEQASSTREPFGACLLPEDSNHLVADHFKRGATVMHDASMIRDDAWKV